LGSLLVHAPGARGGARCRVGADPSGARRRALQSRCRPFRREAAREGITPAPAQSSSQHTAPCWSDCVRFLLLASEGTLGGPAQAARPLGHVLARRSPQRVLHRVLHPVHADDSRPLRTLLLTRRRHLPSGGLHPVYTGTLHRASERDRIEEASAWQHTMDAVARRGGGLPRDSPSFNSVRRRRRKGLQRVNARCVDAEARRH
jgi:hypothetical protein